MFIIAMLDKPVPAVIEDALSAGRFQAKHWRFNL
jgi:hypothetical protein